MNVSSLYASVALLALGLCGAQAQNAPTAPTAPSAPESMRFFVTSVGSGRGGDLGGLAGADAHCQSLAAAVGAGSRTWHAYLSTQATEGAVNARDRIGHGPWYNAKATLIARDLDELHGMNTLTKQTALTEKGAVVNGRGDTPNMHDILTGSQSDGKAFPPGTDMTCKNWTSSTAGTAMLGHSDRTGIGNDPRAQSWNSSHLSRDCSQDGLKSTGGVGLFYCFATN
jgi:hypothetical protein